MLPTFSWLAPRHRALSRRVDPYNFLQSRSREPREFIENKQRDRRRVYLCRNDLSCPCMPARVCVPTKAQKRALPKARPQTGTARSRRPGDDGPRAVIYGELRVLFGRTS